MKYHLTIQAEDALLGDVNMSEWIVQHPYLFMFLYVWTTVNVSHMVTKVAEHKYRRYEEDE